VTNSTLWKATAKPRKLQQKGSAAGEQGLRTQKHITLDEIGRRIAIGNFQELNIIVKGDVDGSVEALSDSLIKLSTRRYSLTHT
jgi:translation initiation factor IF-2